MANMANEVTGAVLFNFDRERPERCQQAYQRTTAAELGLREWWFRDAIASTPGLVTGPCELADLTDEDWHLWGVEAPVEASDGENVGNMDVLLLSGSGRIGIVETKLAHNREGRREVLAQLLDYAIHLAEMSLASLPPIPDYEGRPVATEEDILLHLAQRDFLLVVAGDKLDRRAVRLSQALVGAHLVHEWSLAFVDLALYRRPHGGPPDLLVVPSLRGRILSEVRQVVRVAVPSGAAPPQIHIEPIAPQPTDSGSRERWTEERFSIAFAEARHPSAIKALGEYLLRLTNAPDLRASWGTGKNGSLTLKRNGKGLVEFYVGGQLGFRPEGFVAALGSAPGEAYAQAIKDMFGDQRLWGPTIPPDVVSDKAPDVMALLERVLTDARKR